jgi:glycosyltransferase involved in cell wall biosynthesis
MKIAYDHQIFWQQKYGGISRYFFELARNLAVMEMMDVKIVSPLYVNEYLANNFFIAGIRGPWIRGMGIGRIYRALDQLLVPRALRRFDPDIVHETYYSSRCVAPRRAKVVITVHDMIHELFYPGNATISEKQAAVRRADHVICISENTRRDLIRLLNIEPEKTTVVHLGFALTCSEPAAVSPVSRPYLLYVGSRGGYKNFDVLLEAYASSPGVKEAFGLVAFGGGDFLSKERALLRHYGLNERQVQQINGNDAVLGALYKHAALFVYPSLYEGFGIPPLEAMSFGCPVVCSNTSSIPEVVGNAAVLFDPHSVESISKALQIVLNDEALLCELRARGRERVRLFSWQTCAQQTLSVYKKMLS